jgi:NAD(P)-dependent dehydrogenase (short-subunit alcohol dehydrogenase family)
MMAQPHKVALVTGSSKGIGQAIALRLARAGYNVYVTYFEDEKGGAQTANLIREAGGTAHVHQLDVRSEASVSKLFSNINNEYGYLDLLVNNAVKEVSKPIDEATLEEWRTVLSTKLDGAFLCTKAALPLFEKASQPSVIVISTYEGQQPSPNFPAYGVANAGLDAFVKAMALFLPRYGARCNAVCPGPVNTPLWGPDQENEELWNELAKANPVARNATPQDVAEVVAMIADEPTRMLNGNFVYVNGGNHLRQP